MILFHKKCHQLYQKFVFGGGGPKRDTYLEHKFGGGLARFLKKSPIFTVSPPEGVQTCVRGKNRGFWAWGVHFWGFQTHPGPPWAPKFQKYPKTGHFFQYFGSSSSGTRRIQVFFAYSCSHRPYGSNGVSHAPNPAGGWEKMGPKVGPVEIFGVKMG